MGAEWQALSSEQKAPYVERAQTLSLKAIQGDLDDEGQDGNDDDDSDDDEADPAEDSHDSQGEDEVQ